MFSFVFLGSNSAIKRQYPDGTENTSDKVPEQDP